MVLALVRNAFAPASFLYVELIELRTIELPWGESFFLAVGEDNPWRVATELALLSILVVVGDGCYQFWIRGQRWRSVLFGCVVVGFMACFGTHALFVDTGRLNSPYLSTYGFLALAGLMSYELAGEVLRKSQLSSELELKEIELLRAVADERSRIAADLHDSVTQTLFSTAAIAEALPHVWERQPEEARNGLEDLKRLTKGAMAEMRTLLLELRPAALIERDLSDLLKQLGSATAARTHIPVEVVAEKNGRLPDEVQVAFYRAAQEALHNIVKHADASHAEVQLINRDGLSILIVRDDGRGVDETESYGKGMGLQIMRDRIVAIGGSVRVESSATEGTTIEVTWASNPDTNDTHE